MPSPKSRLQVAAEIIREYAFTKGPLGPPKLLAKFLLLIPRQRLHRRWLAVLRGPTTRKLLASEPRVAFRHSSKYLFLGVPWRDSVAMLTAHYVFVNASLDAAFFERIISAQGAMLWHWETGGHRFGIVLRGPERHREGDFNLCFVSDDVRLATVAFSVLPASLFARSRNDADGGRHVIYVGHVQGAPHHFEAIRMVTRRCRDIAPNDLLMSALSSLAQAWQIERLLSPGPDRHLSFPKMPAVRFDYAGFWARYGGVLDGCGHYAMSLPFPRKTLDRIVNRHRKRTARKRDFKQALCDSVARSIAAGMVAIDHPRALTLPTVRRSTALAPRSRTAS